LALQQTRDFSHSDSTFVSLMQGKTKQRWLELCVNAVVEEDPERLMELAWEINQLLAQEELRLKDLGPVRLAS
jgi:hypothetical protein